MKIERLVNTIIVMLAAAGLSFASLFAFAGEDQFYEETWEFDENVSFDRVINSSEAVAVRRNGRDAVVLLPESEVFMTWDENERHLDIALSKGAVVFATEAADISVSVITDFARVDSESSRAYVALDEEAGQLEVYGLNHPSLVTFVLGGEDLNSISIPMNYRMKVPASKISEKIGKLRLTKLSKEFPVFELDEKDYDTNLKLALAELDDAYTENSVSLLAALQGDGRLGPSMTGFSANVHESLYAFEDVVTFLPHAEARLNADLEEELLVYAMSNLLYGDAAAGELWLSEWKELSHNAEDVRILYSSLFFVLPGDELYPVKIALADVLYSHADAHTSLRRMYQEIESLLAEASKVEAEKAYQNFHSAFQAALRSGSFDDEKILAELSREYMLLELLLRSNNSFYKVEAVSLLSDLEEKILALSGSDQDLDEERQAFVQSKIRFLTNLFDLVEERKISVDEATDLANELLYAAESYLNSIYSDVAVRKYFESLLDEYDLSVQFMNSPEFYSYSSFEDGVAAFQKKADDLDELNDYIQNLRAGDVEESESITLEEALGEVEMDLLYAGVTYSDVNPLEETGYRLFELKGAYIAGYAFAANYDRETQILYDIVIGDTRFPTGLLLDSAREVIEQAMTEEDFVEEEDESSVEESVSNTSLAEKLATGNAKDAFEKLDLDGFDITLVDLGENLFVFEGELSNANLPVSGTYNLSTGRVSEIIWEMDGEVQTLPDLDLSSLEDAVYIIYQALRASQ